MNFTKLHSILKFYKELLSCSLLELDITNFRKSLHFILIAKIFTKVLDGSLVMECVLSAFIELITSFNSFPILVNYKSLFIESCPSSWWTLIFMIKEVSIEPNLFSSEESKKDRDFNIFLSINNIVKINITISRTLLINTLIDSFQDSLNPMAFANCSLLKELSIWNIELDTPSIAWSSTIVSFHLILFLIINSNLAPYIVGFRGFPNFRYFMI